MSNAATADPPKRQLGKPETPAEDVGKAKDDEPKQQGKGAVMPPLPPLPPPPPPPPVAEEKPAETKKPVPQHQKEHDYLTVGDVVHWWDTGVRVPNEQPRLALVTKKGTGSLCLTTFDPGQRGVFSTPDGVRHIDDPGVKEHDRLELGCWEFTPRLHQLYHLRDIIAKLEALLG